MSAIYSSHLLFIFVSKTKFYKNITDHLNPSLVHISTHPRRFMSNGQLLYEISNDYEDRSDSWTQWLKRFCYVTWCYKSNRLLVDIKETHHCILWHKSYITHFGQTSLNLWFFTVFRSAKLERQGKRVVLATWLLHSSIQNTYIHNCQLVTRSHSQCQLSHQVRYSMYITRIYFMKSYQCHLLPPPMPFLYNPVHNSLLWQLQNNCFYWNIIFGSLTKVHSSQNIKHTVCIIANIHILIFYDPDWFPKDISIHRTSWIYVNTYIFTI